MYKASLHTHKLIFNHPGGTSRGVLTTKMSYYIHIWDEKAPEIRGVGECSILPGLSCDDRPQLPEKLKWCCNNINKLLTNFQKELEEWPAIRFALEMAEADLKNGGKGIYYHSDFIKGKLEIPINGLIWMGQIEEMKQRIEEKLEQGFNCLKLKIGALDFDSEIQLLKELRKRFNSEKAPYILDELSKLSLHSIEQPIKAGLWKQMADLCANTPLPIALDEELIGLHNTNDRKEMMSAIKPQYIILKPSLTGGFSSSEQWMKIAKEVGADWWITSALEANVGLNAIAQWTAKQGVTIPQGLGTGQVFSNNTKSRLIMQKGKLKYLPK